MPKQDELEKYMFQANRANLWAAVKGDIKSFLNSLWAQGALAGQNSEEAFKVAVGLGETMTAGDILDGKMKVSVEVALISPETYYSFDFIQEQQ